MQVQVAGCTRGRAVVCMRARVVGSTQGQVAECMLDPGEACMLAPAAASMRALVEASILGLLQMTATKGLGDLALREPNAANGRAKTVLNEDARLAVPRAP